VGITAEQAEGLGVAFDEATLLGAEIDRDGCRAAITLRLLTLPEAGPSPDDSRVSVRLSGLSRVVASLRNGRWDDRSAPAVPFPIVELLPVVQSFGGCPVYGGNFVDRPESDFERWADRLSVDWRGADAAAPHTLTLFQAGGDRHLDLRFWFADVAFVAPAGGAISIDDVIADGRRWWDAFYRNDPRTQGLGMFPMK